MRIKTQDSAIARLRDAQEPIRSEAYRKMLDGAISAYEASKVVSDRELELLVVGVEVPSRWGTFIHNN